MSHHQRLAFVTRHFNDLQTIRFAPVPVAMILALAAKHMPGAGPSASWGILSSFLLIVVGFYSWSTVAIKRRYGSVKEIREDRWRMRRQPIIVLLYAMLAVALVWLRFFTAHGSADVYLSFTVLIFMLTKILDSTNLTSRRIAWALGLVTLFGAGPFLVGVDGGAAIFSFAGGVWLSLSIFDFLLLRQILDETSPGPQQLRTR